jgi:hypothetical protein
LERAYILEPYKIILVGKNETDKAHIYDYYLTSAASRNISLDQDLHQRLPIVIGA